MSNNFKDTPKGKPRRFSSSGLINPARLAVSGSFVALAKKDSVGGAMTGFYHDSSGLTQKLVPSEVEGPALS
jgi:hypothetical protein